MTSSSHRLTVDVLMPSFNDGRRTAYIREALQSLTRQTHTDFRCVVSDNGSPVPFRDVAGDLLDERLEIVRQPKNLGLFGNWNFLFGRATEATHLALLEDDNAWEPDHLARLVEAVRARPDCSLAVSSTTFMYDDGRAEEPFRAVFQSTLGASDEPAFVPPDVACASSVFRHTVQSSSVLVRRAALQPLLPFRESFPFADGLVWDRLASEVGILFVPGAALRYRFHPASASASSWIGDMSLPQVSAAAATRLLEISDAPADVLLKTGRGEGPSSWWNALHALYLVGTPRARAVGARLLEDYPGELLSVRGAMWRRPDDVFSRLALRALGLSFFGAPHQAVLAARRNARSIRRKLHARAR